MRIAPSLVGSLSLGLGAACFATAPAARAEPDPSLAVCGASQLELSPGKGGAAAEVRGQLATPKGTWQFVAKVGLARVGQRTRTLAVEEPRADGKAASPYAAQPSQVFLDLFPGDKKLTARHASEGGTDPEIALTLTGCRFGAGQGALLAGLAEPRPEPAGCDAATLRKSYAPRIAPLGLGAAEADRAARALCEDHQKTIAARVRLEQRLSDQAAQQRAAARGRALLRVEEDRIKAWDAVDACLEKAAPADPPTAAKLAAAEEKLRACYDRAAPAK
jgi:hypothetical protein